mmetsp:Transcript_25384/g.41777  ORF Transcript_25384/g.41777 Transcript_25384/m.41777 type:complete len:315 (-) Transcript_25384:295-1239(-)|eukprot:CAMPEP_0184668242 /NCGR_PEP_ID=MMETSP0308-20130426/71474_1 /TAXON_ID=38269 /ORGANISM="Gloeochaete witrockiana, Strain SAG 46.84" /LENGTH=314 /DNA_ID=CAMNT_0027113861 /DNA_START=223 /DNA_END=1167 /DNA_ORIENTATION=+
MDEDFLLDSEIVRWLHRHGIATKPNITPEQQVELKACFEIIDSDGSGIIDHNELAQALSVMGIPARKEEIIQALRATDPGGQGVFDLEEFSSLMIGGDKSEDSLPRRKARELVVALPFPLLSAAYRRKRMMDEILVEYKQRKKGRQDIFDRLKSWRLPPIASASPKGVQLKPDEISRSPSLPLSSLLPPSHKKRVVFGSRRSSMIPNTTTVTEGGLTKSQSEPAIVADDAKQKYVAYVRRDAVRYEARGRPKHAHSKQAEEKVLHAAIPVTILVKEPQVRKTRHGPMQPSVCTDDVASQLKARLKAIQLCSGGD